VLSDDARALMARINKKCGDGSLVVASQIPPLPRFTSGSLSLDVMLGGGWPGNQWSEVIGSESSGKTTIAHKTIAANQRLDPEFTTLWIAAEGYDQDWAEELGVDTSRVIVHSTNSMEEAYTAMLDAAESRAVDAIVLDSYPALIANDESAKEMDEFTISAGARVTGKFFRKAGGHTKRSLVQEERPLLGLIINQFRDKIGGFSPNGMTPKTSPGGNAKNYAYYVRLEVSRTEWLDEKRPGKGLARCGQVIKLKTIKNKAAAPQQVASIRFFFADSPSGFRKGSYDLTAETVAMGVLYGVISKTTNGWYSYGDQQWHGEPAMCKALNGDDALREQIDAAVHQAISGAR
jgi:recombination protein RecA